MTRSATLPPIRVAPETKASVEAVLRDGESLTQFIESAVRREAEYRAEQNAALARARKALRSADKAVGLMTKEDFLAVVKDVTDGKGVELVLESVGGDVFDKSMAALRPLGRLIVFGIASADARRPDVRDMLFRNLWVIGLHLGALMGNQEVSKASSERLFGLLATGRIVPQIGHVLGLEEAARAQDLLGDRGNYGKVVIKP